MEFSITDILTRVYGINGIPFPQRPRLEDGNPIAEAYPDAPALKNGKADAKGVPLYANNALGQPVFMPAKIDGVELPNPVLIVTGEKTIVETDLVDVGTVFERCYDRPYRITIICQCQRADNEWPEAEIEALLNLWKVNDVVTLECAFTRPILTNENNLVIRNISLPDMRGVENAQLVQFDCSSNIEFELELVPDVR